jgi:hypothetical protein
MWRLSEIGALVGRVCRQWKHEAGSAVKAQDEEPIGSSASLDES